MADVEAKVITILQGDCRERMRELADGSISGVITSPPYWALRDYGLPPSVWGDGECSHEWGDDIPFVTDDKPTGKQATNVGTIDRRGELPSSQFCRLCSAWKGCLGLEPTPEMYVQHLVTVFREIRRVLRDDGTVWLNLGDSYASQPSWGRGGGSTLEGGKPYSAGVVRNLGTALNGLSRIKQKDLIGIPWRVAFALQADGWWLRSAIVWAKGLSFCPTYSGSVMPESVTDRPTSAYEMVFLLSKSKTYYYDADAVKEQLQPDTVKWAQRYTLTKDVKLDASRGDHGHLDYCAPSAGRNIRNVWCINSQGFPGAHFATFPPALVEPCIKAGTSERGVCPECGAPWVRVTAKSPSDWEARKLDGAPMRAGYNNRDAHGETLPHDLGNRESHTLGWRPTCECDAGEPRPAMILDPFGGAGTTALKARELGRDCILIELSEEYCEMTRRRLDGTEEIETVDHNGDEVVLEQARLFSGVVVE